ncbi:Ribonuclease H-like domain containing protein [Trema orientale]|uniref:Ribonuclease H-like domain containing protein n=1 Tax=Trema orientale TaxID=63057 RepID=A0A2P5FFL7_TREOI|nr:Ribonuclease H-like domain containing protein [Trema orientale]
MICAAVGRDHLGSIIFSITEKNQATSPLVGEIRAAILGIKEALKLKIKFCVLEGDSRAVISSINTGAKY